TTGNRGEGSSVAPRLAGPVLRCLRYAAWPHHRPESPELDQRAERHRYLCPWHPRFPAATSCPLRGSRERIPAERALPLSSAERPHQKPGEQFCSSAFEELQLPASSSQLRLFQQ